MTMTLALSPFTNDIFINNSGAIQIIYGQDEVRQRIIISLMELYGEYFLNRQNGVPWRSGTTLAGQVYAGLLGSKDLGLVESVLRMTILNVPNVLSIASLQLKLNAATRAVSMAAQVEVQGLYGPSIISILQAIVPVSVSQLAITTSTGIPITTDTGQPIILG